MKLYTHDQEKILKGIKAYRREQKILLRLIRKNKEGLSDSKFDRLFSDFKETITGNGNTIQTRRPPKLRFFGFQRESFILGNLTPYCEWEKWLHLLQLMCAAGLVKMVKEGGHIYYRIPTSVP